MHLKFRCIEPTCQSPNAWVSLGALVCCHKMMLGTHTHTRAHIRAHKRAHAPPQTRTTTHVQHDVVKRFVVFSPPGGDAVVPRAGSAAAGAVRDARRPVELRLHVRRAPHAQVRGRHQRHRRGVTIVIGAISSLNSTWGEKNNLHSERKGFRVRVWALYVTQWAHSICARRVVNCPHHLST